MSATASSSVVAGLSAGVGLACVTPPLGVPMEGLGQREPAQAVHDDLFVRVLSLAQAEPGGATRACAVVGMDLLFFARAVTDRFAAAVGGALGLGPEQVLLNVSHSHTGPRVSPWAYSDGPDPAYLDRVEAALVAAARQAAGARRPVTLAAGCGHTRLPVQRRKPDGHGGVAWAPHRAGPVCDAVPFCVLRDASGAVVALPFSVSCHPSMIYECVLSAEYPGAAMRRLNAYHRTTGALFLQGAGGDAKPRHVAAGESHWRQGTWAELEGAGEEVVAAIAAAAPPREVAPALAWRRVECDWPLAPAPSGAAFQTVAQDAAERPERRRWAADMAGLVRAGRLPDRVPVRVHVLQLAAGVRLVGIEGELVGELGNRICALFPGDVTFPMGYTGGCQLYLPTTAMLAEGGYEVESYWEYHWPAPLAAGGDARLIDAVRRAAMEVA